jgi:hypothetical protein
MAEEIRLHLEHRIREFVDRGFSEEQARVEAYRQFGPVESVKEACRDERRRPVWVESTWQDLRYGVRSLLRDRAFTAVTSFTLTLGVGLVTSFFSVLNATMLKPWPLPDPGSLVTATRGVSPVSYRYMREHTRSLDLVAMTNCPSFIDGDPMGSGFRCVSGNYFDVLRVPLIQGRGFRPDEDVAGAPRQVVVIGYGLWRDRFSSSPDAIGRTIGLNQIPFEIVGVAARGATDEPGASLARLWVPLAAYPLVMSDREFNRGFLFNPEYCCVDIAGRLSRDQPRAAVSAELTALHRAFRGETSEGSITLTGTSAIFQPWEDSGVAIVGLILTGIVLVLLVACANARITDCPRSRRRHEFLAANVVTGQSCRIVRRC